MTDCEDLRGRAGWQYCISKLLETGDIDDEDDCLNRSKGTPVPTLDASELLRATSNAGSSYTRTQLPHRAGLKASSQTSPSYL